MLLVLYAMFRMRTGHYNGTGGDICTVLTADAVATGEVSCYNFMD